jgi:hypothetical protein
MTTKTSIPKKTSIAVSPDLWHAVRMRALEERRTVVSILEQLLQGYLNKPVKKGGR